MSLPKTMVFIDGENLVMRYQAMLSAGYEPLESTIYIPDYFVWHHNLSTFGWLDIARVSYYTSIVGDDLKLLEAKKNIAKVTYRYRTETMKGEAQIVPVVFKKLSQSKKTRNVDINIVIDIMRSAHLEVVDHIYLVSGDGDYLPLIQEVMRRGKQVVVGALSSGVSPELTHSVDEFIDLDGLLFKSKSEQIKARQA